MFIKRKYGFARAVTSIGPFSCAFCRITRLARPRRIKNSHSTNHQVTLCSHNNSTLFLFFFFAMLGRREESIIRGGVAAAAATYENREIARAFAKPNITAIV